jgi:hypothetical protein
VKAWEAGFHATNGEIVRVSQVDDHGRIHLEDGRTILSAHKHFEQRLRGDGSPEPRAIGRCGRDCGETMSRELFYVAASRGREQFTVITSDKARLQGVCGEVRRAPPNW